MVDVALAFMVLASRPLTRARLAAAAGVPVLLPGQLARLAVLAGLHDLGKLLAIFQNKAADPNCRGGHVAELLGTMLARPELASLLHGLLAAWFSTPSQSLYAAVCHHGGPVAEDRIMAQRALGSAALAPTLLGHQPLQEIRAMIERLLELFPASREPNPVLPWTPMLSHLFPGILMAADWLASDETYLPWTNGCPVDPAQRQALVTAALAATGWDSWSPCPDASVILPHTLRPAQQAILELPLDEPLVLLEAMTGDGKTEAAVLHALRLIEAGKVDGLYFAVPTRSAATELHARIANYMVAAHPALAQRVVRAVPGLLDTDDNDRDLHDEELSSWALGCPRRALAAPIAVGTIDQALLSILRAKHAWMRRAFLASHLLVIDEVHAGDAYMLALVERLAHVHLDHGGHVLAMSATLGETARARLTRTAERPLTVATALSYPLLTAGIWLRSCATNRARTYFVESQDLSAALATVQTAVRAGAAVLIIRSTVTDALATCQSLRERGLMPVLHHSRYAEHDRRLLDQSVLDLIGSAGHRGGCVIVATQTCEQSLDIDADLLVTDAAPADVLLQRWGRLHRHDRSRPVGYGAPKVIIIAPAELDLYLTGKPGQPQRGRAGQGWAWVYPVPPVAASLAWLGSAPREVVLPQEARAFVEAATHPENLSKWAKRGPDWEVAVQAMLDRGANQAAQAGLQWIEWQRPYWFDQVPSPMAVTRLGEGTVTVETAGLVSPFDGKPINALPVPARWLKSKSSSTSAVVIENRISFGSLSFVYDQNGLRRLGSFA